ncbi:hypothetical protein CC80DRAFT_593812 [Byssothecium circinans]|uniref:RPA43 OB domain-containing protein n=1 Tax=Byssothecium circinans TaxID=147558 RepID=A0A6A5TVL5_9PLEO|nr:hypothetical protein CC80DRAFT_593812 [Byssothecium circinans]
MAPIPPDTASDSVFYIERISQYVSLPPASLTTPLPAICASVFSPLLLTYFAPVKGVVLGFEDVRLSDSEPRSRIAPAKSKKRRHRSEAAAAESAADEEEENTGHGMGETVLLRQIDEYTAPFVWATASLLVWRPKEGDWITATLTHQSATHVTLSHLNTFPVSVLREQLPRSWRWHAEEAGRKTKGWDGRIADLGGWWVDGEGLKVGEGLDLDGGKEMRVRIREWDARGGMGKGRGGMKIEGSMMTVEEERVGREKGKGRADGRDRETGGVVDGEVMEVE